MMNYDQNRKNNGKERTPDGVTLQSKLILVHLDPFDGAKPFG